MVVYGRLEALSSCAKQKLCSFSPIVDMIEAFDHMTLLSVSNYLLLTRDRDRKISREWTMSGALVDLVEVTRDTCSKAAAAPRRMRRCSMPGGRGSRTRPRSGRQRSRPCATSGRAATSPQRRRRLAAVRAA
jgi:hypothetical protein